MDIELGIQNVARTVTFSTEQSADEVNAAIADAVENGKTNNLTDDKGRRIVVPAGSLGYAIIGSETKHAVGFGNLCPVRITRFQLRTETHVFDVTRKARRSRLAFPFWAINSFLVSYLNYASMIAFRFFIFAFDDSLLKRTPRLMIS